MKALLRHAGLTLALLAVAITGYHHAVVQPAQRVGLVDVGEVYRQKEAEFTAMLTRANHGGADANPAAGDAEREQALALARQFAQHLPVALDELSQDCGCLVILRSAVASPTPRTVDLTALLHQKLATR